MPGPDAVRLLEVQEPLDLIRTLKPLADGGGDPTWRFVRDPAGDRVVRALWTPGGAATVEVVLQGRELSAAAWGPGAAWILERVDWMVGLHDDPGSGWQHLHPTVLDVQRRMPGVRLGRALRALEVMVPTVLGQRVTTAEARASWRRLVWRYGHAAPGTVHSARVGGGSVGGASVGTGTVRAGTVGKPSVHIGTAGGPTVPQGRAPVRLAPRPATLARLGDADWHRLGVERGRVDGVRGLLGSLAAIERAVDEPAPPDPVRTAALRRILESHRRIGAWTSTSISMSVLGDPDVVLLGDLHVPHGVCHALAGEERGSDERMLELLEPFRPQRGRVVRLLKYSGTAAAPRRGPRYTPLPIAEM